MSESAADTGPQTSQAHQRHQPLPLLQERLRHLTRLVGDDKLTWNYDIRKFNRLDTPEGIEQVGAGGRVLRACLRAGARFLARARRGDQHLAAPDRRRSVELRRGSTASPGLLAARTSSPTPPAWQQLSSTTSHCVRARTFATRWWNSSAVSVVSARRSDRRKGS